MSRGESDSLPYRMDRLGACNKLGGRPIIRVRIRLPARLISLRRPPMNGIFFSRCIVYRERGRPAWMEMSTNAITPARRHRLRLRMGGYRGDVGPISPIGYSDGRPGVALVNCRERPIFFNFDRNFWMAPEAAILDWEGDRYGFAATATALPNTPTHPTAPECIFWI